MIVNMTDNKKIKFAPFCSHSLKRECAKCIRKRLHWKALSEQEKKQNLKDNLGT